MNEKSSLTNFCEKKLPKNFRVSPDFMNSPMVSTDSTSPKKDNEALSSLHSGKKTKNNGVFDFLAKFYAETQPRQNPIESRGAS